MDRTLVCLPEREVADLLRMPHPWSKTGPASLICDAQNHALRNPCKSSVQQARLGLLYRRWPAAAMGV